VRHDDSRERMLHAELGRLRERVAELEAALEARERADTEDALRTSEERYRSFFMEDITGDYVTRVDGTVLDCNPAFARMLGFDSVDEVLGCKATDLYPAPRSREEFLDTLRDAKTLQGFEIELRRKDGTPVFGVENVVGVFDDAGDLVEIRGYIFDITEHKRVEEQLRQSLKMEAVGRLAGGVAHDFNNVLTAVLGYADLLSHSLTPESTLHRHVREIRKAGDRASALTRQLLAFSRRQVLRPEVLDLNAVVRETDSMLRRLIPEDIELLLELQADLGRVKVDPVQMQQVIINLAVNARDAMPDGGTLVIRTAEATIRRRRDIRGLDPAPGPYVVLTMKDTGVGIERRVLGRIFEPFYTTKAKGEGTGLGLSLVYGIVRQSGGDVRVTSEAGQGATFQVYLPMAARTGDRSRSEAEDRVSGQGCETVLLVEDEAAVRSLVRQILENRGYRVLDAPNGESALELSRSYDGEMHLLLTDVVMPGMSGRELADAMVADRPSIRVLYMSGYTDDAIVRHGVLEPGLAFIQKPFRAADLVDKIRSVLDGSRVGHPA
jgi:PAS domain S-box-containing protein